jgi:FMN reductase
MRLVTVYGSPTPPGKLARALGLVEGIASRCPGWTADRVAPAEQHGWVAATWDEDAVRAVADADAVVLASPVYRGSITGTLKLLIDMLPVEALRSKPVGILTVAAAPHHFLSAERHLRDVLSWFGALGAPNAAFFVDQEFRSDEVSAEVLGELEEFTAQLVTLAERLEGRAFGPDPLTVKYQRKHAG